MQTRGDKERVQNKRERGRQENEGKGRHKECRKEGTI
jgi:hypothetical protein